MYHKAEKPSLLALLFDPEDGGDTLVRNMVYFLNLGVCILLRVLDQVSV
jgi:hypothetical protein